MYVCIILTQVQNGFYMKVTNTNSTNTINISFYDLNSNLLLALSVNLTLYSYNNLAFPDFNNSVALYGGLVYNFINKNVSIADWNNANFS